MDEAAIAQVRDTIYRSMGEAEAWPDALRAVSRMVGATGVVVELPTFDVSREYAIESLTLNVDFKRAMDYAEVSRSLDPWTIGALEKFPACPGIVVTGQQMTTRETILKSHWHAPVVIPAEMGDVMTATLEPPPQSDAPMMMAVFHRHRPCEPFELEAATRLKLVQADLSRAARVAYLLKRAERRETVLARAMDAAPEAIFILARSGVIHFSNAAAEALLRTTTAFSVRQGRLHMARPMGKSGFPELLMRVALQKRGADFPVELPGRRPLLASIAPMPPEQHPLARQSTAECVLTIRDPDAGIASVESISAAFQLTLTESRIARSLLLSQSVASIAAAQNVSPDTVRWHLKSIFSKLGVNRQSELVRLLSTLKGHD
jgi:DNA-binding CsgD family transcriptional regulator